MNIIQNKPGIPTPGIKNMMKQRSHSELSKTLIPNMRQDTDYSEIKLLGKQVVLFTWMDDHEQEFTHASGLIIKRELNTKRERWGRVVKTTDDSELKVGEFILPEKVDPEFGTVYNGIELWRTYDEHILLVSSDITATYSINE